jgi:MarR-like DNA-binding transcriptional regulator SgrR of sgrS sRNA
MIHKYFVAHKLLKEVQTYRWNQTQRENTQMSHDKDQHKPKTPVTGADKDKAPCCDKDKTPCSEKPKVHASGADQRK